MDLNPIGEPPSRFARWCPSCRAWFTHTGVRRCAVCQTALVRQTKPETIAPPKPWELRPGVVAEFTDRRDAFDPARELAELRARLKARLTRAG